MKGFSGPPRYFSVAPNTPGLLAFHRGNLPIRAPLPILRPDLRMGQPAHRAGLGGCRDRPLHGLRRHLARFGRTRMDCAARGSIGPGAAHPGSGKRRARRPEKQVPPALPAMHSPPGDYPRCACFAHGRASVLLCSGLRGFNCALRVLCGFFHPRAPRSTARNCPRSLPARTRRVVRSGRTRNPRAERRAWRGRGGCCRAVPGRSPSLRSSPCITSRFLQSGSIFDSDR